MDEHSTRERIILSALACIEKEGLHSVTIRSVAREAGVNSAAINYYFGSKKKLIEAALQLAMKNAMANFEMFEEKGKSPFEIFREFFRHNFEGMVNYPEIVKARFYNPFTKKVYDRDILEWKNKFLDSMLINIKRFHPEIGDMNIKLIVMQTLSAMLFPAMFPGMFDDFTGIDLKNPEIQKVYIDFLLDHYLGRFK